MSTGNVVSLPMKLVNTSRTNLRGGTGLRRIIFLVLLSAAGCAVWPILVRAHCEKPTVGTWVGLSSLSLLLVLGLFNIGNVCLGLLITAIVTRFRKERDGRSLGSENRR